MEQHSPRIHRFLISTTSRFVGEYQSDSIALTHAWPNISKGPALLQGMQANPHSRNYYVLSAEIEDPQQGRVNVIPNYRPLGDRCCAALSILFGKRFDNHGLLVSHGMFGVPDFSQVRPTVYFTAGPNSHAPRPDLEIELNLVHFGRIAQLFTDASLDQQFIHILFAAGRFYVRSLQMFDVEPEFAYLDLVTCGEILANYYKFKDAELYDDDTRTAFERIRTEMPKGDKVVRKFRGSMRQIKRAYTLTITRLMTDYFFGRTESTTPGLGFRNEDFEKRVKAAYDLRSLYVHTGIDFGRWVSPHGAFMNEVQIGAPIVEDERFAEAIKVAPIYFGLERVMRYCLLRFIHLHGFRLDDRLDGPAPSATTAHHAAAEQQTEVESAPAGDQPRPSEHPSGDLQTPTA